MRMIIVQHCQSEHHINDMTGGWTDTPLTDLGRSQAEVTAMRLQAQFNCEENIIYTSDLLRASQTASIISERLNSEVLVHAGLRERNTGIAAGKTKEWAKYNRNPRTSEEFDLDYQEFLEGETWRQFYNRVCAFVI